MRYLKYSCYGVCLIMIVFGYTILCTTYGLKMLVNIADSLSEAKISASTLRGSLYRGVVIRDFIYEDAGSLVSIDELALHWQVMGILFGHLNFSYITAIDTSITTIGTTTNEAPAIKDLWLPPLSIESLMMDKIVLMRADQTQLLQLDALQFNLAYGKGKYNLQDVLIKNKELAIYANGSVEFPEPFNTLLISQVVITPDKKTNITTDLRLSGNRKNLLAQLRFHENLTGSATITIRNLLDDPEWKADIELDNVNPRLFDPALPEVTGDIALQLEGKNLGLKGKGRTQLAYKLPVTDAQADSQNTRQVRQVDSDVEFGINFAADEIVVELDRWQLATEEGTVEISGQYNHSKEEIQLDARWQSLVWPLAGLSDQLATSGTFSVAGKLDSYTFQTDVNVSGETYIPPLHIIAPGSGKLDSLTIKAAQITTAGGVLSGDIEASWQGTPGVQVNWQARDINPGEYWREWPGDLQGAGELHLSFPEEGFLWDLKQAKFTGELRSLPFSLILGANSSSAASAAIKAEIAYAKATASVQGQLAKDLELNWQIDASDLSLVHPQMQGQLTSQGNLTGSMEKPGIKATIVAKDLRSPWGNAKEISSDLSIDLSSDALINAELRVSQLDYQNMQVNYLDVNVDGHNSRHRFTIKAALPDINIDANGDGELHGSSWTGLVDALHTEHKVYREWETLNPFTLKVSAERLSLEALCLGQAAMSLCFAGHYIKQADTWELKARAEQVPLSVLQTKLPESVMINGLLGAHVDISGEGKKPLSGNARLDVSSGSIDLLVTDDVKKQIALEQSYLHINLAKGMLMAEGGIPASGQEIKALRTRLQIDGFSQDSPSLENLSISGELETGIIDLSILTAILPQLLEVKGSADLDLQVSGTLADPHYDGSIVLADGGFSSPDVGIEVREINFKGSKKTENLYEIDGNLLSGEGHLDIRAEVGAFREKGPEFKLVMEGDDFELINLPAVWALVMPQINGKVSLEKQSFEGSISIPAAKINLDELALPPTLSADEIVNNEEMQDKSRQFKPYVKVKVLLGEDIQIKGMGISGSLVGKLDVLSNKQAILIGDGEIAIADGKFSAYGQKLTIQEGRLIYNKTELDNPMLSVIAIREVDDIKAGLKITGFLSAPDISLFSSPSLPQEQILSYIVFGRPLNTLSSGEGSDLLGAAASMGLRNSSFITEKVAARFGLDQVSISGDTAQTASLVVGKYLNPKLYLSYGLGIFDKISTAKLRYDLSKRFSVEAERGTETGVDVFYKIDK